MTAQIKIDFVSDVACPWCAVGLGALEQAIARLGATVEVDMHFQPFELNPQMPPGGQDLGEHLTEKYGVFELFCIYGFYCFAHFVILLVRLF